MQHISRQLKIFKIIHLAILTGAALFFCVASFLVYSNKTYEPETAEVFHMVVPLIALLAIMASRFIPKRFLDKINPDVPLTEKLTRYSPLFIMRCAFIEGAVLFSIVAYMITGDTLLQAIAVVLLITLGIQYPAKTRIIMDLKLDAGQRDELLNS